MILFFIVLLAALAFGKINGFHAFTANAIATVVSTKVLTPRMAILLATLMNLCGAFLGESVAKTIGQGQVDTGVITMTTILAALFGAIIWNLLTWWFGIPSSSSHALIGGLCGAALATSHGNWGVLIWDRITSKGADGLWPKVIKPMIISPVFGFVLGFALMALITACVVNWRPRTVNGVFEENCRSSVPDGWA